LRGERTGIRYAIGTRVRVQVSRVDLDGRKIDFRLVQEGEGLLNHAMADKGLARDGKVRDTLSNQFEPDSHARRGESKSKARKSVDGMSGKSSKSAKSARSSQKSGATNKKVPRLRR
jgi:ribonuclease R